MDPTRRASETGRALALSADQKWALVSVDDPDPTPPPASHGRRSAARSSRRWDLCSITGHSSSPTDRESSSRARRRAGSRAPTFRTWMAAPRALSARKGCRISVVSPDGDAARRNDARRAGAAVSRPRETDRTRGRSPVSSRASSWCSGVPTARLCTSGESTRTPLTLYRVDLETGKRALWKELRPAEEAGLLHFGAGPKSGVRVTPDGRKLVYAYWTRQNGPLPRRRSPVALAVNAARRDGLAIP